MHQSSERPLLVFAKSITQFCLLLSLLFGLLRNVKIVISLKQWNPLHTSYRWRFNFTLLAGNFTIAMEGATITPTTMTQKSEDQGQIGRRNARPQRKSGKSNTVGTKKPHSLNTKRTGWADMPNTLKATKYCPSRKS